MLCELPRFQYYFLDSIATCHCTLALLNQENACFWEGSLSFSILRTWRGTLSRMNSNFNWILENCDKSRIVVDKRWRRDGIFKAKAVVGIQSNPGLIRTLSLPNCRINTVSILIPKQLETRFLSNYCYHIPHLSVSTHVAYLSPKAERSIVLSFTSFFWFHKNGKHRCVILFVSLSLSCILR